jgi:hypothetical protein
MYYVTEKSSNVKTGKITVVTSGKQTCPITCPFKNNGCYADGGPLRILWDRISRKKGVRFGKKSSRKGMGISFDALISKLASISRDKCKRIRLWQAGDMPGDGKRIAGFNEISKLIKSLIGLEVFGFSHYPVITGTYISKNTNGEECMTKVNWEDIRVNRKRIKQCNSNGVAINLSANNLAHADQLANLNIGPVCTTLPSDINKNIRTPEGRRVVICPAVLSDSVSCKTCGGNNGSLCYQINRDFIIGFPAHGFKAKEVSKLSQ